jgi:hypothetical protein
LTELTNGQHAYVYHPDNVSAQIHPLAVQQTTVTTVSNFDTDLTVEKRLNVSKELLVSMSLTAGKLVEVSCSNGVMSLVETTVPSDNTLIVNTDGRLRIGEKTLLESFGQLPAKYNMSVSSDRSSINIKPL